MMKDQNYITQPSIPLCNQSNQSKKKEKSRPIERKIRKKKEKEKKREGGIARNEEVFFLFSFIFFLFF